MSIHFLLHGKLVFVYKFLVSGNGETADMSQIADITIFIITFYYSSLNPGGFSRERKKQRNKRNETINTYTHIQHITNSNDEQIFIHTVRDFGR